MVDDDAPTGGVSSNGGSNADTGGGPDEGSGGTGADTNGGSATNGGTSDTGGDAGAPAQTSGGDGANGGDDPGQGGGTPTGGGSPEGGDPGEGTGGNGTGGVEPGNGGSSTGGAPTGGAATGGTDPGGDCDEECQAAAPTVLVLFDGSSSLYDQVGLWDEVYTALMDPEAGVIASYQDQVWFGFTIFRGNATATTEADPACAELLSVPFDLGARDAIDETFAGLGDAWYGVKSETPTGHALRRATELLVASDTSPTPRKYLLLVTDGDPNTCSVLDPQCGQDLSIDAVQDARSQGIRTLVMGIGGILAPSAVSCTTMYRCGPDHLQDLANAGVGATVVVPPPDYPYSLCVSPLGGQGVLAGTYGPVGGSAAYYTSSSHVDLVGGLSAALDAILANEVP